jgi:outer membrane protein insertion porin family
MRRAALALALAAAAGAQEKAFPLRAIQVEGAERYTAARVAAACGLKIGDPVTVADFAKASQALAATGYFTSVNFRYAPLQGGYALTLQVVENGPPSPVALDVPGVEEEVLWKEVLAADPLADRALPLDESARARFADALERVLAARGLATKIASKLDSNLATGRYEIVFGPAATAIVRSFRLAGNQAVDSAAAARALGKSLIGAEFTPRGVRRILDLNLTPIYEERGYLRVSYGDFAIDDAGLLSIVVREGMTYRLGGVELAGDNLPVADMREAAAFRPDELANWKAVLESAGRAAGLLRRDGFVEASHEIERRFRERERVVDLIVYYRRGPRYSFGRLTLAGLPAAAEAEVRALWPLASGAPMNPDAVDEFLAKSMALASVQKLRFKGVVRETLPGGDATTLDVKITFR